MPDIVPIPINLDSEPVPLFSVIDDALGGCDDFFDMRIQSELKDAFHKRCNGMNRSMAERLRELMALDAYGTDHIASLISGRIAVVGIGVPNGAGTAVPTSKH